MLYEIWTIKGKNPCAIYVYDDSIKCIIEENKIKDPVNFIKACFGKKDYKVTELENDDVIKNLPHPYYGLCYNKNFIKELVIKSGLYYELYLHDPKNAKFTTPSKFFNDVANLIKSGKKVGWFQGRWAIDMSFDWVRLNMDLNRCIIEKKVYKKIFGKNATYSSESYFQELVKYNNLFRSLIEGVGYIPQIAHLQAYNPQEAIAKLKNKEIDVLVIANIIVARKKEDLKCGKPTTPKN